MQELHKKFGHFRPKGTKGKLFWMFLKKPSLKSVSRAQAKDLAALFLSPGSPNFRKIHKILNFRALASSHSKSFNKANHMSISGLISAIRENGPTPEVG